MSDAQTGLDGDLNRQLADDLKRVVSDLEHGRVEYFDESLLDPNAPMTASWAKPLLPIRKLINDFNQLWLPSAQKDKRSWYVQLSWRN